MSTLKKMFIPVSSGIAALGFAGVVLSSSMAMLY
jgi:hypothetical protein